MPGKEFKQLFLAHQGELHAYLKRKLGNADTATDLTQETFLRFARHRETCPEVTITHERSYLYRIAHNLAVDHLRRARRGKVDETPGYELVDIPDEAPTPEQAVSNRSELSIVREAILEMPERTRHIFILNRIEGLTYREVATRLNISESSVQKHLAKATKRVMQRLRAK